MTAKKRGRRADAIPVTLELLGVLEEKRDEFERKFGRPPKPGEPLFFDPQAEVPRRLPERERRAALAGVLTLSGQPEHVVRRFTAAEGL